MLRFRSTEATVYSGGWQRRGDQGGRREREEESRAVGRLDWPGSMRPTRRARAVAALCVRLARDGGGARGKGKAGTRQAAEEDGTGWIPAAPAGSGG